ncbi:MAG TPA: DUF1194 domain-containing protein [Rhizobiaceae bacterium]|nr:DUF1194 domain-containing protein [Rhizobiaceae bacterium]
MRRWRSFRFGLAVAALLAASPARADACALTLVLAMDASASVDAEEFAMQRTGLAQALVDPEVMDAILSVGGIQAFAFEWSGRNQQVAIADWRFLDSGLEIAAFASQISKHERGFDDFPTALGHALGYASVAMQRAPRRCERQVVDVSGDGVNNESFPPRTAYAAFPYGEVTVNGLVIAGEQPNPVIYYRENVIRGPGAFVEVALNYADYGNAMRRKLLREIFGASIAGLALPPAIR